MNVYKTINKVQADLARQGISKDHRNTQGAGYNFRGIDDVYNAISPLLAQHGLCILPRMLSRSCEERQSKSGGALFYVTVEAEFDFVCAEDGSKHTVKTYGEAMDSGDKGTNKAMSAAYKYACFQAFAIPTEGDNDADASTHEVSSKARLEMDKLADQIVQLHDEGLTTEAVNLWYSNETIRTSNEAREYVWSQLREWSAIRSAIKANKPEPAKQPEKQAA